MRGMRLAETNKYTTSRNRSFLGTNTPSAMEKTTKHNPAVSEQQRKFFGVVKATQKGEMPGASAKAKKVARTMTVKQVREFAKTKKKKS